MVNKIQKMFALSNQGAKDLIKGCLGCIFQDITFMIPVGILYYFVLDLINKNLTPTNTIIYIIATIITIVLIFISTRIQYTTTYFATYVESGRRRIALAENLRKLPLSYFNKKDLADLTSTIMTDSATMESIFSHYVPSFIGSIVLIILMSLMLLVFNLKMGLAAVWVVPVALIIVFLSLKTQDKLSTKKTASRVDAEDGTQEFIESSKDLKTFNAENDYLKGLNEKIDILEKRTVFNEFGTAIFVVLAQMILKLGIVTIALVGSYLFIKGEIDIAVLLMFLIIASRFYDPLQGALINLAAIIAIRIPVKRTSEILEHESQTGSEKLQINNYDIEFKNVSFSYNKEVNVINNLSFVARQGEVTALVGPSGSGKTTVSRLAARFWDINKGTITVGGKDISKVDIEELMKVYSVVFQDVTLFNNTIIENIRIGKKDATDNEVLIAAKLANCDEFAFKLKAGYNSYIGENGCNLSGGERQRISIARAFLKDAPIILLDEATASLDTDNETIIQEALSKLIKNKTVLIIAHRMRTIARADKIIVLDKGTIVENGSPEELSAANGMYSSMVKLQHASQSWNI